MEPSDSNGPWAGASACLVYIGEYVYSCANMWADMAIYHRSPLGSTSCRPSCNQFGTNNIREDRLSDLKTGLTNR